MDPETQDDGDDLDRIDAEIDAWLTPAELSMQYDTVVTLWQLGEFLKRQCQ